MSTEDFINSSDTAESAPSQDYTPLPEREEKPRGDQFDSDVEGLREAAKSLAEDRRAGKFREAEPEAPAEPIDRSYRWQNGAGAKVAEHLTVTPERAAEDLTRQRAQESAQDYQAVASAVDQLRANYSQLQQQEQAPQQQPQAQSDYSQPQQQHQPQAQQPDDGLHPDVRAALPKHVSSGPNVSRECPGGIPRARQRSDRPATGRHRGHRPKRPGASASYQRLTQSRAPTVHGCSAGEGCAGPDS
jgi:hypothetical protein